MNTFSVIPSPKVHISNAFQLSLYKYTCVVCNASINSMYKYTSVQRYLKCMHTVLYWFESCFVQFTKGYQFTIVGYLPFGSNIVNRVCLFDSVVLCCEALVVCEEWGLSLCEVQSSTDSGHFTTLQLNDPLLFSVLTKLQIVFQCLLNYL